MNYTAILKKSYLLSSFLITCFFSLIFCGFLLHNYYWEVVPEAQEIKDQVLTEKKEILKEYINVVIGGIESDVELCANNGSWESAANEIVRAVCNSSFIVELARNRLASASTHDGIVVSTVDDFSNANDADSISNDGQPFISLDPQFIEEVLSQKELFVGDDLLSKVAGTSTETLTYFRYYARFNWIISAGYDRGVLVAEIEKRGAEFLNARIAGILSALGPFFFFIALVLVTVLFFFIRIAKISDLHEKSLEEEKNKKQHFAVQLNQAKNQEDASAAKDQLLQQIFESLSEVIVIHATLENNTYAVRYMSQGVAEILGYEIESYIGKSMEFLLAEADGSQGNQPLLMDQLKYMKQLKKPFSVDGILSKETGGNVPVHIWVYPILGEGGELQGTVISAIDTSKLQETKRLLQNTQERLLQAQKLEAIGTLAGGIAHDFNNVLTSIVGYSELLHDQLVPGSMARNDLEQILHATSRASDLVKQIHAFSRKKDRENSFFEPGIIVKESLKMLRSTLPSTIIIKQDIRLGETIYVNTTQFHQLFMNLCTNAFRAMEASGGLLKVSLQKIENISHVPRSFHLQGDTFIELVVSDSGCGISEEVSSTIFEPFLENSMTNKPGSGLCDNYNMVVSAGGAIWFHDQRSGGTEFHVLFPVRNKVYSVNSKINDANEMHHGTESILFVDDEEDLTIMARKMFESLGYTVHCQTNCEDALREYLDNPEGYDLIITDQSMPGMTGSQLTQKIRKLSYTTPVILCTGYSAKITEENWRKSGINGFVIKPFRKKDIARMVREVLDTATEKTGTAKN